MSESADRPPDPLDRPGLSETQVRRLERGPNMTIPAPCGAQSATSYVCPTI